MDPEASRPGTESQGSDSPVPTVSFSLDKKVLKQPAATSVSSPMSSPNVFTPTSKGVENAKKRLRAFSIQKKTPLTPVPIAKPVNTSGGTVFIGKFTTAKTTPKPEDVVSEPKKPAKPPKPGTARKNLQEHIDQQKKTLSEIEDMKRKMELVELGIPLGLICPAPNSDKAMPTKAMPPIKSFLDPAKVDEIILEAKKAKAEGREFKFNYQKLLPGYDNPFQRKKEEPDKPRKSSERTKKRRREKYSSRHSHSRDHKEHKDHKDRHRDDRDKHREEKKSKDKEDKKDKDLKQSSMHIAKELGKDSKETDVNLSEYLVCDSWSLDNEDKNNSSSPKLDDKSRIKQIPMPIDRPSGPVDCIDLLKVPPTDSPKEKAVVVQKLQPVIDSFEFEIDPNEDEMIDIFDEDSSLDKFAKATSKKDTLYDSPVDIKSYDELSIKDISMDASNDDKFLQSVINEIKQGDLTDEGSQDKGLVEYDMSPTKDDDRNISRGSITPELKDLNMSQRSDYSDGYKSGESGYKSIESGCKSNVSVDSQRSMTLSMEKELESMGGNFSKSTVDSLETWSFILKICQPLLFRHDKNKCYKETRSSPKIWFTENPKICNCVKDRSIVYDELERFKMTLVDRVYGCDQISDTHQPSCRTWYPRAAHSMQDAAPPAMPPTPLAAPPAPPAAHDWEAEDSQPARPRRSMTPQRNEEIYLDREYQRFMQAVLSDVSEKKTDTSRSTTPVTHDSKRKDDADDKKKAKKHRLSSEGWSQESDLEEEVEKRKKMKVDKVKDKSRKRKHSTSSVSESDEHSKKKKKSVKKKNSKSKSSKRLKLSKKYLKKLKQKKKKKLLKMDKSEEDSEAGVNEKERKKKEKKAKKKKLQKLKRKNQKKKKNKAKSSSSSDTTTTTSSSSTSSDSSTDSDTDSDRRSKRKKKESSRRKKRKQSSSDSPQSEELFDVNILNNIKTEKVTDDEKQNFSPRKKPREIINVKELQNDFVGNNIHIKKEQEAQKNDEEADSQIEKVSEEKEQVQETETLETSDGSAEAPPSVENVDKNDELFKEPLDPSRSTPQLRTITEESNQSQSSQESVASKDRTFEKDESHLRALSPNSNYSFNDVIAASGNTHKEQQDEKFATTFQQGNYEMYEQMALSYSSEAASQEATHINIPLPLDEPGPTAMIEGYEVEALTQEVSHPVENEVVDLTEGSSQGSQRIETVVRARIHGEIKCDWRPTDLPPEGLHRERPSRWGLKPGEVNIVLTGDNSTEQFPIHSLLDSQPVYQIQSLANRTDSTSISYDEAYMDTYGALDRLQYGDCFGAESRAEHALAHQHAHQSAHQHAHGTSLDERINRVLQDTVLGEVAKEAEDVEEERDGPEKGILITKTATESEVRGNKRVSFADGYKPGQDSDVEEPPVKKRKKVRRYGCAWPCPASHPDHVSLWDALPPPPPPPGSPPPHPPPLTAPLTTPPARPHLLPTPMMHHHKFDPSGPLPGFMPPEPPPGLITF